MMDRRAFDVKIVNALANMKGIVAANNVNDEDRDQILLCEEKAEKQSLMGLGKVINSGIRDILKYEALYVALTQMNYDWCHQAALVLKKRNEIVGEEIRDKTRLAELRKAPNVWFMHKNFVVYKDRINFPRDVVAKICHFEIPGFTADWFNPANTGVSFASAAMAIPSVLGDVFLKEHYFDNCDEHGTGTLLVGIARRKSPDPKVNRHISRKQSRGIMNKTQKNLEQALHGEAQACIRYQAFAKKADEENLAGVARLFRAAATAEKVHARSHQCALAAEEQIVADLQSMQKTAAAIALLESEGEVRSTTENLKKALEGETFEFAKMYPLMIKDAVAEKQLDARHSLEYAMTVEMEHARLFKKALAQPDAVTAEKYHICPLCGHTATDKPPSKCPYCGVDGGKFIAVE